MSNESIRISGLGKVFPLPSQNNVDLRGPGKDGTKKFVALDDINLTVNKGEVVGIIGENGAGKSTLLKILSRVLKPSSGEIEIFGHLGSILELGTGFHPELTGRDNINMNGHLIGMTKQELDLKIGDIIEFAELGEFIDVPVKHYSSGMYMRLAFAITAHLNHDILIFDEVLAVGDQKFQQKCLGKMRSEMGSGRTVLFVSHNMAAVRQLCSRCIYLKNGKVFFDGQPDEAIARYIGSSIVNDSTKVWNNLSRAPGNVFSRIRKVTTNGGSKDQPACIDSNQNIVISIDYEVIRDDVCAGVTLAILDSSDSILFGSINNEEHSGYDQKKSKGIYNATATIPGNLLNAGVYYVTVFLWGAQYTDVVRVEKCIKFQILNSGFISRDYFGVQEGPFMPLIKWENGEA